MVEKKFTCQNVSKFQAELNGNRAKNWFLKVFLDFALKQSHPGAITVSSELCA